jgi:hypothetical protein
MILSPCMTRQKKFANDLDLVDTADKQQHVGDRPVNDHRYLFLRISIMLRIVDFHRLLLGF